MNRKTTDRRWIWRVVALLAGLTLAGWSLARIDAGRAWAAALEAHAGALLLMLAAIGARFVLWAVKWHRMLAREADVGRFAESARSVLGAAFLNLTTPTAKLAGGVWRAELLVRRRGWRRSAAYGQAILEQFTTWVGTLLLLGGTAAWAVWGGALSHGAPIAGAAFALLGLLLAARRWLRRGRRYERFIPAAWRGSEREDARRRLVRPLLQTGPARLAGDSGWSLLSLAALGIAYALSVRALGADLDPGVAIMLLIAAQSFGTLTGSLGGLGTTEFALIEMARLAGVPGEAAAAAAVLQRGGFYAVVLLAGGAAFLTDLWGGKGRTDV